MNSRAQVRRDVLFLFLAASAAYLWQLGAGSLASWDEAYYAVTSRGIFQTGDWVHLRFFDTPIFDKPPLYYWVTAVFYHLAGVSEWTTRLFSALSGIGLVIAVYVLGRELFGRQAAVAAGVVLLTSKDFIHYARWGTLDVAECLFLTLAVIGFVRGFSRPASWLLFWVACALAVMTKGPLILLIWA
ncbi:MAG: glycosyltransferase family 39 protein, partial [Candidatus Omnitrophica bacterium]|nr:glycosyltransferase family 39 protein [Candidatus Omnitrophota bacterium]